MAGAILILLMFNPISWSWVAVAELGRYDTANDCYEAAEEADEEIPALSGFKVKCLILKG